MLCLTVVGSCFNPDYGNNTFKCVKDSTCPDGYRCEAGACVKDGTTKADAGPTPKDRGTHDYDFTVRLDGKVDRPQITLLAPKNSIVQDNRKDVTFAFGVNANPVSSSCTLYIGTTKDISKPLVIKTFNRPVGVYEYTYRDVLDGLHYWKVTCTNPTGTSNSDIWAYNSTSTKVTACKKTGWVKDRKYKLDKMLENVVGDCFVIEVPNVLLDGGGKYPLRSDRRRDLLVYSSKATAYQMYQNMIRPPKALADSFPKGKTIAGNGTNTVNGFPHAADLDGDDDIDLLLGWNNGQWVSVENALSSPKTTKLVASGAQLGPARVLDFDGDGKPDIFVTGNSLNTGTHPEKYFAGKGSAGSFEPFKPLTMGAMTTELDIGDFDQNGTIDLLAGNMVSGNADARRYIAINLLRAARGFASPASLDKSSPGLGRGFSADIDGDNSYDLVVGSMVSVSAQSVRVYRRKSTGSGFEWKQTLDKSVPVAVANIIGDSHPDLVTLHLGSGSVYDKVVIYPGTGMPKGGLPFDTAKTTELKLKDSAPIAVARVADMNGDYVPDIIMGPATDKGWLAVAMRKPDGSVERVDQTTITQGAVNQIEVRDLNNDGLQDLLISRHATGTAMGPYHISYLANYGTRGLSDVQIISGQTGMGVVSLGDLTKAPASAIRVGKVDNVTIRNFAKISGFSVGIDLKGSTNSRVSAVGVLDPEAHGVRLRDTSGCRVSLVAVRNLYQGSGLTMINSSNTRIEYSTFCPMDGAPHSTAVGSTCLGNTGTLTAVAVSTKHNNGCKFSGASARVSCK